MITTKDFFEPGGYRITGGSEYQWKCFGHNARYLDSEVEMSRSGASMIFDSENQTVYQVTAYDYTADRAYRWTHPNWAPKHMMEVADRGVTDNAWDDVAYIDLEVAEDMMIKTQAIVAGEDYDTRVSMPVEFTDEELLKYMKLAHERDITFNQFVEDALREAIEEHKRDPEGAKQRAQRWKDEKGIL
jgi:hypothetical protein